MPQALPRTLEAGKKRCPKWDDVTPSSGAAAVVVPRVHHIPHRPRSCFEGSRVSRALFTLWCRLLESYQSAAYDDACPFLVGHQHSPRASAGAAWGAADDARWQSMFGPRASAEALIFHLYYGFIDVDTAGWVIAFCIIDNLQLQHIVRKKMQQLAGSAGDLPFLFHLGNSWRNLFVAYCLALKWHLDYNITINDVVNLLPHTSQNRPYLCMTCAMTERQMLHHLDYNVTVRPGQLLQLLDNFLMFDERECVMEALVSGCAPRCCVF
ncbi:hypothetical protein DQ04_00811000 [Trypanosoma grayi]|uniref:hypothetical protein n=1 Tax=Trypanosoma grayi TaxID=71804 RepID=UPI0004F451D7|nr:hypothetical protein DQ04_00811000 [Trypanosoma grayi]KEG13740.1 hypothetical protein DQ04_00811000 [Trypanosoma grayi]